MAGLQAFYIFFYFQIQKDDMMKQNIVVPRVHKATLHTYENKKKREFFIPKKTH